MVETRTRIIRIRIRITIIIIRVVKVKERKSSNTRLKTKNVMLVFKIVKSVIKIIMMKDKDMLTDLIIHRVEVVLVEIEAVVEAAIVMTIKGKRLTLIVPILPKILFKVKI